ncbi:MAG: hypothetical protein Q9195_000902 [Heterodermia aff. obscurata]
MVQESDNPQPSDSKPKNMDWDLDRQYHESLILKEGRDSSSRAQNPRLEEVCTAPLFTADVLRASVDGTVSTVSVNSLPQYGLLAGYQDACRHGADVSTSSDSPIDEAKDKRLFLNTNTPWSAFICGSQGSGKSHTLSCMLEASILPTKSPKSLGKLPHPIAGILFHYDKFTGLSGNQMCEAAYLCSTGIPVKVLVSPASFGKMQRLYSNLPNVPVDRQPTVHPLLFEQHHLDAESMLKLMAVEAASGSRPLYMEIVCKVLRQCAMANQEQAGFNFKTFQNWLNFQPLQEGQRVLLEARLELLKDFIRQPPDSADQNKSSAWPYLANNKKGNKKGSQQESNLAKRDQENREHAKRKAAIAREDTWFFKPGSLTIVDRDIKGRIVALDEAHKFLNDAESASTSFTESLLSVIRQQRHLATRVIIATQEPTISPKLLDLCSMTLVHRFTSPSWLHALKSHLAGVSVFDDDETRDLKQIFQKIVNLDAGDALLFSPSMILSVSEGSTSKADSLQIEKLSMGYLKMRVRARITADGGRSIQSA